MSFVLIDQHCQDWISYPYQDTSLLLYKRTVKPVYATGWTERRWFNVNWHRYQYDNYSIHPTSNVEFAPDIPYPNWGKLRNQAIAGLNPNTLPYDPFNFLWELKDLPRIIRDLGRFLEGSFDHKSLPGFYLSYSFGWAPLISDLKKMLTFASDFDRRMKSLYRAGKKRRVRRKLLTDKYSYHGGTRTSYALNYRNTQFSTIHDVNHRAWFTADLIPRDDYPRFEKEFADRFRRTYSLSQVPLTVWNSLPWTWLIDYFTGIGTLLEASKGTLPYLVRNMNIMYESDDRTRITYSAPLKQNNSLYSYSGEISLTDGEFRTQCKQRRVYVAPVPRVWFSLALTRKQRRILGSLVLSTLIGDRSGLTETSFN